MSLFIYATSKQLATVAETIQFWSRFKEDVIRAQQVCNICYGDELLLYTIRNPIIDLQKGKDSRFERKVGSMLVG